MRKCRQILVGRSVFLTWSPAQAGFDDALLTGPDGVISEGAITNIGFFDGNTWHTIPVRHQLLRTDPEFSRSLAEAYGSVPWDPI
jgi:hypothetical protein